MVKKSRCWYTAIGNCLDYLIPITPEVGNIRKDKKD